MHTERSPQWVQKIRKPLALFCHQMFLYSSLLYIVIDRHNLCYCNQGYAKPIAVHQGMIANAHRGIFCWHCRAACKAVDTAIRFMCFSWHLLLLTLLTRFSTDAQDSFCRTA